VAQDLPINPSRISLCCLRVTRLNDDGTPADPPNNAFVSRKLISLQIRPDVQAASTKTLVGGCDSELLGVYNIPPIFMGQELTLSKGHLEPAMEEMLLGGTVIFDGSDIPVPIGVNWPSAGTTPPPVAIEAWARNILKDHPPGATDTRPSAPGGAAYPYTRYLWPMTRWAPDNNQLDADFQPINMVATVQGNVNWGVGPWGDQPHASGSQGFYVFDTITLPAESLTYTSTASS
jgi:hypothetical protein